MGKIIVWNTNSDLDYSALETNFYIARPSPLGNPFTHAGKRTNLAKKTFPTIEQCLTAYEMYFDELYGKDPEITEQFDRIYEQYKQGKDIYLQCFCKPKPCHGDIIARKLQQKLIKEKMEEIKKKKHEKVSDEKKN